MDPFMKCVVFDKFPDISISLPKSGTDKVVLGSVQELSGTGETSTNREENGGIGVTV